MTNGCGPHHQTAEKESAQQPKQSEAQRQTAAKGEAVKPQQEEKR